MACSCIRTYFSKLSHKQHQKSILRQDQKDAQIKVDEETKFNTGMNAQIEAITEPRLGMGDITEEEYDRGVIDYREYEPITITLNDVHGVTHIQEVINFNLSVPLDELSNLDRIETAGKELSSESQDIVEMVESNHTPMTNEFCDRENLQIVEVNNPAITNESSDKESLEMVAIDMDGQETRITWREFPRNIFCYTSNSNSNSHLIYALSHLHHLNPKMPFSNLSSFNRLFGHHCPHPTHCPTCQTGIYNSKLPKKTPKETISFRSIVEEHFTSIIRADPRIIKRRLHVFVGQPITLHLATSENEYVHEYLCFDWGKPESLNLDFQEKSVKTQQDLVNSWELAERVSPKEGKRMVIKRGFVVTRVDTEICRSMYPRSPTRYWKAKHTLLREYVDL
ncbi:uncharacterized protein Bfra_003203 [Botrytis fragariae]|uniref:Uncharacterized protein n=1 Tax=Botrytis fragariae TaxID=1964551 RepID=A0A8H6ELL8_9HELO|nr:uncharacterized protein Bfra_003203 [Botrytis fragariae]KAF5876796.1 hypothetical protein Bfra_003203 [Botrytis fragariae]